MRSALGWLLSKWEEAGEQVKIVRGDEYHTEVDSRLR